MIADQLCFRETIVIGHLQEQLKNAPPTPVGGICLNIQKAKGSHPLDRKIPSFTETPREDTETTTEDIQEIKEVAHEFSGLLQKKIYTYTKTKQLSTCCYTA